MLTKSGMPAGVCVEEWALCHPECVRQLQNAYIDAGSDIVYAPTFGANEIALARHGLEARTDELNRELAKLSKDNAAGRAKVFGDLSPTGEMIFPMGTLTFGELSAVYARQAKAMEQYVDGFVCETFMSLSELRAAFIGVRSVSDKPVYTTLTVNSDGRTLCGDALIPSLLTMQSLGAAAFGVNCVSDLPAVAPFIKEAVKYAHIPFIVKPNAGIPDTSGETPVYSMTSEDFARFMDEMLCCGVSVLGGCCGTSPAFIEAIALLKTHDMPSNEKVKADDIACTSREFFMSPPEALPEKLVCGEELMLTYDGESVPYIYVPDAESASCIAECEMMFPCPPVFDGASPEAIAFALRIYTGRAYVKSAFELPYDGLYGAVRLI